MSHIVSINTLDSMHTGMHLRTEGSFMPSRSSNLTCIAFKEKYSLMAILAKNPKVIAKTTLKSVNKIDALIAKRKKMPLSGEEAMDVAAFYEHAARLLSFGGTPELKIGNKCNSLALRYFKQAERLLPRWNSDEAWVKLLLWRDINDIRVAETRKALLKMANYFPDSQQYDCAMRLVISFPCEPLPKKVTAAAEKLIQRYEEMIAELKRELKAARKHTRSNHRLGS